MPDIPSGVVATVAHLGLVGGVLGVLATVYRAPTRINEAFSEGRRPALLRKLGPLWIGGMLAVVALTWWVRLQVLVPVTLAEVSRGGALELLLAAVGVLAVLLEAVLLAHWVTYVGHAWRGAARYVPPEAAAVAAWPRCLVLVPICDEAVEVMDRAIGSAACLQGAARVVLVDNSRTVAGRGAAERVAARHGVERLSIPNRGHKACALNDALRVLDDDAPVVAVFDADQRARPDFLVRTVPVLLAAPDRGFVQTAQGYEDHRASWLRRAAAQQEALLYDSILESFSVVGHTPLCGTNVVYRRAALYAVGGFDETCLSEDLSTGHAMHVAGWRSVYLRELLAIGLAPEDLFAYWRQQRRWATGNTQLFLRLLRAPGRGGWRLWGSALWSSGFYVVACAIGALAGLPAVPLLVERFGGVGAPHVALGGLGLLGLSVYPLYVLVVLFPYVNMALRGYAIRDLLLVQGLLAVSIPRYGAAVARAAFPGARVFYGTRHVRKVARLGPQVLAWLGFLAAGALALDAVLHAPTGGAGWVIYAWLGFYGVAAGHLPLFALQGRAAPVVKPAGVSDIPSLRSARSK